MPRSLRAPLALLITLFVMPLTGCSGCTIEIAQASSEEMYAALDAFTEVRRDAEFVAPEDMQPYIDELTAIRTQTSEIEVPKCAEEALASLLAGMDSFIQAYTLFASDPTSDEIQPLFDQGQDHLIEFDAQIQELAASFR